MWSFMVQRGRLYDPLAQEVGIGYSGHGAGVNNPEMEQVHDVGPIPRGKYVIGQFFDDAHKGPLVARLYPYPETNDFGRSGFMIHGDNITHDASLGCIILPHNVRQMIAESADRDLEVA